MFFLRCICYRILDIVFYDEKMIFLLLVEDYKDECFVLVLMMLEVIVDDMYMLIDLE